MSWLGWARKIGHLFFGGHNASHVSPLPLATVGLEFAKVDSYMKAKVAELPRDQQPFYKFLWQAFSKLWDDFQKLRFENFPQLAAEYKGLEAEITTLRARNTAPSDELKAKFDVTKDTYKYQVKTMKGDLLNLGMKLGVFRKQTNYEIANDFAKTLAPLVHSIATAAGIDLDESSYLEEF